MARNSGLRRQNPRWRSAPNAFCDSPLGCASRHREPIRTRRCIDADAWDTYLRYGEHRRQAREVEAATRG